MTTADALRKAADKIERPGAWTQDAVARTSDGERCGVLSPVACSWCAIGAIIAVAKDADQAHDAQAMAEAIVPSRSRDLARYNDAHGRTAAHVASLLRRAAKEWDATPVTD